MTVISFLAIIYYSTLLSFRVSRLCVPRYKLLFRYPGCTNRSRSCLYLLSLKLSTAPSILYSSVSAVPLLDPPCRRGRGASIFRLSSIVCGPSSLRSRSPWKYLRLKFPATPGSSRSFILSQPSPCFYTLQVLTAFFLHLLSPSRPPLAPSPLVSSSFFFLSIPAFFFIVLTLVLRLHRLLVRKVVIGPSATSDRGGKQPRERTTDRGKGLGVAGDRVIAGATVVVARDPRECLPYITEVAGKYKGHGALPSTLLGASRPSRRSELYPG